MKRDTTLATEVQQTPGFIPVKTVPRLHLAVNEKSQSRYTQQATNKRSMNSSCHVLHKHLPRYKLSDRKLFWWPSLFSGLDYWTHGNCLWGRLNEQQTMHRAKTPSHKTCSSVVLAHLVPSHPAFFVSRRETWAGTWAWLHLNPANKWECALWIACGERVCRMRYSRVVGCSLLVVTAVFFHFIS